MTLLAAMGLKRCIYSYIHRFMTTVRSKTFKSGNSQAVRLPRDVAFASDDLELVIERSGDVLTIYPAKISIAEMAARLRALPAPGEIEERDVEEIPERPGM
ncbi:MAG: AbrB/MazE/SpoVT family DNA-binding domain-containing protein [Pseudomonadota bacterium]